MCSSHPEGPFRSSVEMTITGDEIFAAHARIADSRIAGFRQTSSFSAVAASAISSTVGVHDPESASSWASQRFTSAGMIAPDGPGVAGLSALGAEPVDEVDAVGRPESGTNRGGTLFDASPPADFGLALELVAAVADSRAGEGADELQPAHAIEPRSA